MNNERSLFAPEQFLQVPPTLAKAIGLNEAIVAQHIYWLQHLPNGGRDFDGHRWIWNTYEDWQDIFPFWSMSTIKRTMQNLENLGHIVSCQPDGTASRKKYYRVTTSSIANLTHERFQKQVIENQLNSLPRSSVQFEPVEDTNEDSSSISNNQAVITNTKRKYKYQRKTKTVL